MAENIGVNFNVTASDDGATAVVQGLRRSISELEKQVGSLNGTKLSALSGELKNIANPKFDWNQGLKQVDDLTSKIKAGKLSMGEYYDTIRNGTEKIVEQQSRLSRAFNTPIGKNSVAMTIPSTASIEETVSVSEKLNRTLAVQGELVSGLGTKLQDWGKNTQWAGRQMMVGFTVPFAMAATAAGQYAFDIDKALTRIEKVYDGSIKGLKTLATTSAMDITKSLGTTVKSSLEVMGELASAGKQGEDMIKLTTQTQRMSVLGDMDKSESLKSVIALSTIYKMSTEDVAKSVNYLNAVDAATPTTMKELADAIPIAGATVKQLGGDLKDTTVLLSAFKERGISTVEGANAIKTAMNRILMPTKPAQDLFLEKTGQNLTDLVKKTKGDPLTTFQALSDAIMGSNVALEDQQKIVSKLAGIYQSTRISGLLTGLQDKNGAVAKTKELSAKSDQELADIAAKHEDAIRNSASKQFTIAIESFKTQMKDFGDTALKVGTMLVNGFGKAFEMFNSWPEPLKIALTSILAFMAIAGPLTMLVGLFANLGGGVLKFAGFILGLGRDTKLLTIEQKQSELAAESLAKKLGIESEAAQVLIFQMNKLKGAVEGVGAAQTKAASTPNPLAGIKIGDRQVIEGPGKASQYRTNDGKDLTPEQNAEVNRQLALNKAKETQLQTEEKISTATDKSGKMAKVFSSEAAFGIGAVAGIASMATDTGSAMEKWLNYISLSAIALGALAPVIGKIATTVKEMSAVQALSGWIGEASTGIMGKLKTLATSIGGMFSALMGPIGLGIAAGVGGLVAIFSLITAKQREQVEQQNNLNQSTDVWTGLLGKTRLAWGQIKDSAGQVKDTVDSLADSLRKSDDPKTQALLKQFKDAKGPQLESATLNEVFRMQGQGFSANEIEKSLRAALTAAGKSLTETDALWLKIKTILDFSDAKGDLETFARENAKRVGDIFKASAAAPNETGIKPSNINGTYNHGFELAPKYMADVQNAAQTVVDRFVGLNGVDKKVASEEMAAGIREITGNSFTALKSKFGDVLTGDYSKSINDLLKFDTKSNRYVAPLGDMQRAGKDNHYIEAVQGLAQVSNAELDFSRSIGKALKLGDDQINGIKNINDVLPLLSNGFLSAKDVQEAFNKTVKQSADAGVVLTDTEKQKRAAVYASIFGLDAAKLATNGYSDSTFDATQKIRDNAKALQDFIPKLKEAGNASKDFWEAQANPGAANEKGAGFAELGTDPTEQAKSLTTKIKSIYTGTMDNVYAAYADSAAQIWQQRLDNIVKGFEAKKTMLKDQMDSFDSAYKVKQQDFQDRWDAAMANSKKSYELRRDSIEKDAVARTAAIDGQITAIKNQQTVEAELEAQRQKQFDAEKLRIERLATLANHNIDYNKAIYGGKLDEAAKVQNNSQALVVSWGIDDANSNAIDRAGQKTKAQDAQIKALEVTKSIIGQEKQAKIDALKEEEDAVTKSLENQRKAEQRFMEAAMTIEKQRLQDKLDSLTKEQTAAETKERKMQEMNRRTLDIQLATLKAFIPQNEEQLNEHINRVGGAYGNFGLNLQGAGSQWGQIVGNALQNNVDIARQNMSSDANWGQFGASVANSISQGAFGLNLKDFMGLLVSGKPPPGWSPPSAPPPGPVTPTRYEAMKWRHTGGIVDDSVGSRAGITGNSLHSSEIPIVAQRGEFVINRDAVQRFGTENLARINAGGPPRMDHTSGGGIGLFGGAVAGILAKTMVTMAVNRLADHYAAQNASVAQALGYSGGSGIGSAVDFAKAQDGKPYIWGGVGPAGYDCSGYMSAIANVLTGKPANQRIFATGMVQNGAAFGPFVPGLGGKFDIGVSEGHTAGTLMGVNVESTGDHVRYGKDAHGATDKQFPLHFHIPDDKIVAGAASYSSASGGDPGGAGVERWRPTVVQALGMLGLTQSWSNSTLRRMNQESSGNPQAINNWDSNAAAGHPSKGLMQVIDPTFNSNWDSRTPHDIWNPLSNIAASMKYAMNRYGSLPAAYDRAGGYDAGGDLHPGMTLAFNGTKKVETIMTHETTGAVIDALKKASVGYSNFNNMLQTAVVPSGPAPSVDNDSGGTYNYNIVLNGSDLQPQELKRLIKDTIEETHIKSRKKLGVIK